MKTIAVIIFLVFYTLYADSISINFYINDLNTNCVKTAAVVCREPASNTEICTAEFNDKGIWPDDHAHDRIWSQILRLPANSDFEYTLVINNTLLSGILKTANTDTTETVILHNNTDTVPVILEINGSIDAQFEHIYLRGNWDYQGNPGLYALASEIPLCDGMARLEKNLAKHSRFMVNIYTEESLKTNTPFYSAEFSSDTPVWKIDINTLCLLTINITDPKHILTDPKIIIKNSETFISQKNMSFRTDTEEKVFSAYFFIKKGTEITASVFNEHSPVCILHHHVSHLSSKDILSHTLAPPEKTVSVHFKLSDEWKTLYQKVYITGNWDSLGRVSDMYSKHQNIEDDFTVSLEKGKTFNYVVFPNPDSYDVHQALCVQKITAFSDINISLPPTEPLMPLILFHSKKFVSLFSLLLCALLITILMKHYPKISLIFLCAVLLILFFLHPALSGDEVANLYLSGLSSDTLISKIAPKLTMPLYFRFMHFTGIHTESAARFVSLLFFAGSTFFLYKSLNPSRRQYAILFYLAPAVCLNAAMEISRYSMLMFFFALTMYFFLHPRYSYLWILSACCCIMTHIISVPAIVLLCFWSQKKHVLIFSALFVCYLFFLYNAGYLSSDVSENILQNSGIAGPLNMLNKSFNITGIPGGAVLLFFIILIFCREFFQTPTPKQYLLIFLFFSLPATIVLASALSGQNLFRPRFLLISYFILPFLYESVAQKTLNRFLFGLFFSLSLYGNFNLVRARAQEDYSFIHEAVAQYTSAYTDVYCIHNILPAKIWFSWDKAMYLPLVHDPAAEEPDYEQAKTHEYILVFFNRDYIKYNMSEKVITQVSDFLKNYQKYRVYPAENPVFEIILYKKLPVTMETDTI